MDLIATTTIRKEPAGAVRATGGRSTTCPTSWRTSRTCGCSSDTRSHWQVSAPFGRTVEWDAEITSDQPGRLLAWRSNEGADITNAGRVLFEQGPG